MRTLPLHSNPKIWDVLPSLLVYLISLLCAAILMPKARLFLVYHPSAPVGVG